jgi:hypothetical protein
MNLDPVDLALRHVSETKNLLETLITSSESFDYQKAKLTLKELEKKSRELGKVKAALQMQSPLAANVVMLPVTRN